MKIYLDVSCLNRPFDDQRQTRIRLEAEAIALILERIDNNEWEQVSSGMADIEIAAISDLERRNRVLNLQPPAEDTTELTDSILNRAAELEKLRFKPADAVHVAAAEECHADVFLTCDDRLLRRAKRHRKQLRTTVANPLEWLKDIGNADIS